jgi:hypothetical protein
MKQEILDDVALKLYPIDFIVDHDVNKEERDTWLKGAKWQQEQDKNKYSDEDIIDFIANELIIEKKRIYNE